MGFENFATNEPTPQQEEQMSEFDANVNRVGALLKDHGGDADAVTKIVMSWVEEAKKRYDGEK